MQLLFLTGTDGKISHYAGAESKCNCLDRGCDCFEQDHFLASTSKFNTISSVVVSPDGILHIADQANYRFVSYYLQYIVTDMNEKQLKLFYTKEDIC